MKKLLTISLVFIMVIITILFIKRDRFNNSKNIINRDLNKIAIISDIHLQGDNLSNTDNGILIDAILDDVSKSEIDLLLLLGDNTNSGKSNQHEELINKLSKYEDDFDILITIGNHDLGQLTIKEYKDLYSKYGFNNSYSQDKNSVSYSKVYNNLKLIVLDTGGYLDYSSNPNVSKKTINWFIKELKDVKKNNYDVLCFGHYPIITPQPSIFKEKDVLKSLLLQYNVLLYMAGHLHGTSVNRLNNLYELVLEQSVSYPVSYKLLTINDDSYTIETKYPDIEKYAKDNYILSDDYLNFNTYAETQFIKQTDEIIDILVKDKDITDEDLISTKELFNLLMKHLRMGDLVDYVSYIENHPAKKCLDYVVKGSNYEPWLPKVLASANEYTKGFNIKNKDLVSND